MASNVALMNPFASQVDMDHKNDRRRFDKRVIGDESDILNKGQPIPRASVPMIFASVTRLPFIQFSRVSFRFTAESA